MKGLIHPGIVELYHVCDTTPYLFIVMEYVSGGSVYEDVYRPHNVVRTMKEGEALYKFGQIVSALDYLHKNGIVHR